MRSFRQGDKEATNQLVELFYLELRRLGEYANAEGRVRPFLATDVAGERAELELIEIKALPAPE